MPSLPTGSGERFPFTATPTMQHPKLISSSSLLQFIHAHPDHRIAVWWSPDRCASSMPEWMHAIMMPIDWSSMSHTTPTIFFATESWHDGLTEVFPSGLVLLEDGGQSKFIWCEGLEPKQVELQTVMTEWQRPKPSSSSPLSPESRSTNESLIITPTPCILAKMATPSDRELDLATGPSAYGDSVNRFIESHGDYRIAVWWSPEWNQDPGWKETMPEWIQRIMLPIDWSIMYRTVFLRADAWKDGLLAPAKRGIVLYDEKGLSFLWYGADPTPAEEACLKETVSRWQKEHTFSYNKMSELRRDVETASKRLLEYNEAWLAWLKKSQEAAERQETQKKSGLSITDRWAERITELRTNGRLPFSERMTVTILKPRPRTSPERNHMLSVSIRLYRPDDHDVEEETFEFLLPKVFPLNPPKMLAPEHLVPKHDFVFGPEPWHPANGLHGYLIAALVELFPERMSDPRTWFEFTVTPFTDTL